MPITNEKEWKRMEKINNDPYGKACVDVARKVMELLDEDPTPIHNGYNPDPYTAHGLICKANNDVAGGGLTGFMAGCVAEMVFHCHSRGDEFRKSHNGDTVVDGVINHALLTVEFKDELEDGDE